MGSWRWQTIGNRRGEHGDKDLSDDGDDDVRVTAMLMITM